jgi:PAS domain S-box-containing protein
MAGDRSEKYFRALLEALPVAIYTTDAAGRITFYNEAAVKLSGNRPEIGSDQWCVSWRLYRTDGTPLPHDQCPMAVALKEQRAIRGVEAIAERPDGSRVLFEPYPTPLFDEEGRLCGAVNMLLDLTERHEAGVKSAQLAAIVHSSGDAIVGKTLDGRITSWNAGAERIFGYTENEVLGQFVTQIIPEELHGEEKKILAQLKSGGRIEDFETVRVAKDGRRIDVSLTVSPVFDKMGNVIGASKIARDITSRKQAEETQRLLVNELNHRVKNMLANVQAIVQHTLRNAKNPEEFATNFAGRIQSMASVHSLLTNSAWKGADLRELIRDQLYIGSAEETRLALWGPAVQLSPQMAMHLALMLHELGTNSTKYGALSVPDGRLSVSWTVRDTELRLQWLERGAPGVIAPAAQGFGLTLIEQSAKSQGGSAHALWQAEGVTWEIALPRRVREPSAPSQTPAAIVNAKAKQGPATGKAGPNLSGKRFLVVEDEPMIALGIASALKNEGAEVLGPAGNEDDALRFIEGTLFDGALLDANLHGRSVDEIALALTRRNIPFVFVTGNGREGLPKFFAKATILSKPFSQEQLLSEAQRLVARQTDANVIPLN